MTVPVSDPSGLTRAQPVISAAGAKAVLRALGDLVTDGTAARHPGTRRLPAGIDGAVVGAIGASGETPDQDQAVAQAGVAALGAA